MLPIISHDDAKDERDSKVILLDSGEEWKETAEDFGDYWYVREWEIYDLDGKKYWFDRSAHSIGKDAIAKLSKGIPNQ